MSYCILGINRRMLAPDGLHLSFKGTEHAVNSIEGVILMLWSTKERVQRRLASIVSPDIPEATQPSTQTEAAVSASAIRPRSYSEIASIGLKQPSQTTPKPTQTTTTVRRAPPAIPTLATMPTPAPRHSTSRAPQ